MILFHNQTRYEDSRRLFSKVNNRTRRGTAIQTILELQTDQKKKVNGSQREKTKVIIHRQGLLCKK